MQDDKWVIWEETMLKQYKKGYKSVKENESV